MRYKVDANGIEVADTFKVKVKPSSAIAVLANAQLSTLVGSPHSNYIYTVGSAVLEVDSIDYYVNYPVDLQGLNDFTKLSKPATTITLQ